MPNELSDFHEGTLVLPAGACTVVKVSDGAWSELVAGNVCDRGVFVATGRDLHLAAFAARDRERANAGLR